MFYKKSGSKFVITVRKFILVLSFIIFSAAFSAGCSHKAAGWYEYNYYGVMNSAAVLKVYADGGRDGEAKFKELAREAGELLSDVENSISCEIETSAVARFNAAGPGEKVEIDFYARETLLTAKNMYEFTGGAYNPAVYYSVKVYGFNTDGRQPTCAADLPGDEEISEYVRLSESFAQIELTEENGKFYAVKPAAAATVNGEELSLKIDLGGIGKGFAADAVNGLIEKYGFGYGYFSFGSSSIAFKKYPDESLEYTLKLSNPRKNASSPQSYLSAAVKDACVSTSGDNENYYMLDSDGDGVEERFCHIIDPFTGKPVQKGIITATALGKSAAENDALTTALMAMGKDAAVEFTAEKLSDIRVVFVCEEDGVFYVYTNMAAGGFTVDDGRYKAVPAAEA